MTTTEQIVWAHRVDKDQRELKPGDTLRVYADLLPASDGTAPFAIHTFNQITGGDVDLSAPGGDRQRPLRLHRPRRRRRQTAIGRAFAREHGLTPPYYATPGDGIFHFYFPEQGLVVPGPVHSRRRLAQPRLRRVRRGRHRRRVDDARVRLGDGLRLLHAGDRRGAWCSPARCSRGSSGKDIVLELLRRWGAQQSQGMSVEFVDADRQLPIAYRNTIANMMAEAEALNGIFAADDDHVARGTRRRASTELPYPRVAPGADARYEIDEELSLVDVAPMIAKPFSPGNAFPGRRGRARAHQVRQGADRLVHQRQLRRSAAGGAGAVSRARAGVTQAARPLVVFPGSGGVARQIEQPDPRLGGESIADVFRSVGGEIRQSWCGPCFGQGPDALQPGQRAITSFNRNWQNRMGVGGEGYLASPAIVAASALVGYMAPPSSSA